KRANPRSMDHANMLLGYDPWPGAPSGYWLDPAGQGQSSLTSKLIHPFPPDFALLFAGSNTSTQSAVPYSGCLMLYEPQSLTRPTISPPPDGYTVSMEPAG